MVGTTRSAPALSFSGPTKTVRKPSFLAGPISRSIESPTNTACDGSTPICSSAIKNTRTEGFTAPIDDEKIRLRKTPDSPLRANSMFQASAGAQTLVTSASGCVSKSA